MSSHHIVREKQEPALVIHNRSAVSKETLGQLLEWCPTIICSAEQYVAMVATGIKVDIVIGQVTDSPIQENVRYFPLEEDAGDFLQQAMAWLRINGYEAANIVSDTMDFPSLMSYNEYLTTTVLWHGRKTYVAKTGFIKWFPKSAIIHLEAEQKDKIYINHYQVAIPCAWVIPADGLYEFRYEKETILITEEI